MNTLSPIFLTYDASIVDLTPAFPCREIYSFFSDLKVPSCGATMTFAASLLTSGLIRLLAYECLIASWVAFLRFLAKQPLILITVLGQSFFQLLCECSACSR